MYVRAHLVSSLSAEIPEVALKAAADIKGSKIAQHEERYVRKCWIMASCNFNFCRALCNAALLDFCDFYELPGIFFYGEIKSRAKAIVPDLLCHRVFA